ncbi:MAG: hypothetical protein HRT69_00420 [Flavobacteriaceae bacterium]|nr:hypothetical protein [Flavobacteriaceae bacterium]PHS10482.1 MAG: hypothetical protein COA88_01705 [Kordia sp.]
MEKSIETIWKEGFIKNDALVAPKLNDLYNQKSIDIVEKFKRMYKLNRIGIVAFAIIIIPLSYVTGMIYMGIPMALLFIAVTFVAQKFSNQLDTIDKNTSSYEYLSSFDKWVKDMIAVNSKLSTFLYPYVFLAMVLGFWFIDIDGTILGDRFINGFVSEFPTTSLVNGFPILLLIPFFLVIGILAFFGGKIGKWDINLIYGGILNKLEDLLSDMEELRK